MTTMTKQLDLMVKSIILLVIFHSAVTSKRRLNLLDQASLSVLLPVTEERITQPAAAATTSAPPHVPSTTTRTRSLADNTALSLCDSHTGICRFPPPLISPSVSASRSSSITVWQALNCSTRAHQTTDVQLIQQCYNHNPHNYNRKKKKTSSSIYTVGGNIKLHREINYNPSCQTVRTWNDVNQCLSGSFNVTEETPKTQPKTTNNKINSSANQSDTIETDDTHVDDDDDDPLIQIRVIGERSSGTKWITTELNKCFRYNKVRRDLMRSKHFFQDAMHPRVNRNTVKHTIVVAIFRDPVTWTASLRKLPYHAPAHIDGLNRTEPSIIPLPWKEFVTQPWAPAPGKTGRTDLDAKLMKENKIHSPKQCEEGYSLAEVMPCQPASITIPKKFQGGLYPVYELQRDRTGTPFSSILELRAAKIRNHLLDVPLTFNIQGFIPVRYEDLLQNGTQFLMEQVATVIEQGRRRRNQRRQKATTKGAIQLPKGCKPAPPQPDRLIPSKKIPDEFREWVLGHMDKDTERLLGYCDD